MDADRLLTGNVYTLDARRHDWSAAAGSPSGSNRGSTSAVRTSGSSPSARRETDGNADRQPIRVWLPGERFASDSAAA